MIPNSPRSISRKAVDWDEVGNHAFVPCNSIGTVTFLVDENLQLSPQIVGSWEWSQRMKTTVKSLIATACLSGLMAGTMAAQSQQSKSNDKQQQSNGQKNSSKNSTSQSADAKATSKDKNSCGGKNGCGSKPK